MGIGSFQNKSVSTSFKSASKHILSLTKLKEREGGEGGERNVRIPEEHLVVIRDKKVSVLRNSK